MHSSIKNDGMSIKKWKNFTAIFFKFFRYQIVVVDRVSIYPWISRYSFLKSMTNVRSMIVYDCALPVVSKYEQVLNLKNFVDNFDFQDFLFTTLSQIVLALEWA